MCKVGRQVNWEKPKGRLFSLCLSLCVCFLEQDEIWESSTWTTNKGCAVKTSTVSTDNFSRIVPTFNYVTRNRRTWVFYQIFYLVFCDGVYVCVANRERIKSNRIRFDCFRFCLNFLDRSDNQTQSKLDVRLPNAMEHQSFDWVRLDFGSILFDWIPRAYGHFHPVA